MTSPSPDDEMTSLELAPRRLIDGGAGEHERNLVLSARLDRVPSGSKARAMAALGGVFELHAAPNAALVQPTAPGKALTPLGSRAALGALGAGVLGAVAFSVWLGTRPGEAPAPAARAPVPPPVTPVVAEPSLAPPPEVTASPGSSIAQSASASSPRPASDTELTPQSAPARRGADERPRTSAKTLAPPAAPDDAGLLAEVRALESVRAALGAGRADVAVRELAAYRRRFPRGELSIEAEVLAIQIAAARGERQAARSASERLLARPEARHYHARVRALLERDEQPTLPARRDNLSRSRSNTDAAHMRARR